MIEQLSGRALSDGSVVLLFSASHLAAVGLTAYVKDLVAARKRILNYCGRSIYVAAAPPLILGGSRDNGLISNILTLQGWINSSHAEEVIFPMAAKAALDVILENRAGSAQLASTARVRLPKSTDSLDVKKIWAVSCDIDIPNSTGCVTMEQECRVVQALVSDLQTNLALDLDPTPLASRDLGKCNDSGAASLLVVGSSNARRLVEALKEKGVATGYVICKNWHATKKSVEDLAAHVTGELAERHYTTVVYQLLDNNVFFAQFEDGSLCPARKAPDGSYHLDCELVVASKDNQFAIMKLCGPLWEAAKGKNMVVVGPLPRFITAGCCEDTEHITNRTSPDFYNKMRMDLTAGFSTIKDFLFTSGLRHGRVMDPGRQLCRLTAAEIWGSDPVHPKKEVYLKLADGVMEVDQHCGSRGGARRRSPSFNSTNTSDTNSHQRGPGSFRRGGSGQYEFSRRFGNHHARGPRGGAGGAQLGWGRSGGHPSRSSWRGHSRRGRGGGGPRSGSKWARPY